MKWWRRWRLRRRIRLGALVFEPRVVDMSEVIKDLDPDPSYFTNLMKFLKDERGGGFPR